jgi:hypothetical protein
LSLFAIVPPVELNLHTLTIGVLGLQSSEFGIEILASACVEITSNGYDIFDLDVFLVGIVCGVVGFNDPAYYSLVSLYIMSLPIGAIPLVPLGH